MHLFGHFNASTFSLLNQHSQYFDKGSTAPGTVLLFNSFPCFFQNFFCNIIFMQIYRFPFALLTSIMDLGVSDLSLEEIPQTFTKCLFFTQCCTVSALYCVIYTAPDIDLSKERSNQNICNIFIKSTSQSKGATREI